MKKLIVRIFCIAAGMISVLAAFYIGLSVYYGDVFCYGTWVNGVYCTGKTVAQVNEELQKEEVYEKITLILPDRSEVVISMEDIGYKTDYYEPLLRIREGQQSWRWYENLYEGEKLKQIAPEGSIDEKRFARVFDELDFIKNRKREQDCNVWIQKTEEGYILVNEREQVLDYDICKKTVKEAILRGEGICDLLEMGCYSALPLTEEMESVVHLWEKVDELQSCSIVYQFGEEKEEVSPGIVSDWIVVSEDGFVMDEAGNLQIDREKIDAYVDMLADKYDTVGGERMFRSTKGNLVHITGGTYGNLIDRPAEKAYLYEALAERKTEIHEPVYVQEAKAKGLDDIGDTYVEVDMGEQHMYYYEKGELIIDTPIVTGDMMRKRSTPAMVCFVYGKQRNRILRGPGYASFVNYWMPVKGGIGIHDAGWRDTFGGEIYKTSGSHGCINTPGEAMKIIYEKVEIGTPVVMFY